MKNNSDNNLFDEYLKILLALREIGVTSDDVRKFMEEKKEEKK